MATKTVHRSLTEAQLNNPDLDDEGNLDVETFPVPGSEGIDNPELKAAWDEALKILNSQSNDTTDSEQTFSSSFIGSVTTHPPSKLLADPERFQFRPGKEEDGTTRELPEEKFDPTKCQPLIAWKDPADGLPYVVDGHHRLAWAERDGVESLPVQFIEAKDAEEAKSIGKEANANRVRQVS